MSINANTLNNLYSQGILDYVPYEICNSGANVSAMNGMSNPYLNSAMQGMQFQNYGNTPDCFSRCDNNNPSLQNNYLTNQTPIGLNSLAGANKFGLVDIGQARGAGNTPQIGVLSHAGTNAFGLEGIGAKAPSHLNAFGGFEDASNSLQNGITTTSSFLDRIPTPIKGIAAAGIMLMSLSAVLKGKKKPVKPKTSFFSNLNPINWFKKTIKK